MTDALSGTVVLDLGQIYNGSYATFLMGAAGARVIKVEPLAGETLRRRGNKSSSAYAFAMLNQCKESVTLNLKSDKGKAMFRELVCQADVLVENFAPDTMDGLQLGAEVLRELNPRLVYAAGSGYGRSGPLRDYLAMDITVQAMSGVISATGYEDGSPLKAGAAMCDFFGGIHLYGAILTALMQRNQSGQGAFLDVSMLDAVLPSMATVMGAYYFDQRRVPERHGNHHPALTMSPYNVYPAADGHVSIICISDSHWQAMVEVIDQPQLLTDPRFQTMASRASAMAEVDDTVSNWTSRRSKQEVLDLLQAAGVPSAMVRNVEEVLNDPHLHERGMLRDVAHDGLGDISIANSAINIAMGAPVTMRDAPELGSANSQVYSDLLGLSVSQLDLLAEQGVI
jgi:CoA:oxalate CoA-transferase